MVIRKERIELISNDYNELMSEANKEITNKKNNGWYIYFVQRYEDIDGHAVVLEAERIYQYEEVTKNE